MHLLINATVVSVHTVSVYVHMCVYTGMFVCNAMLETVAN